MIVNSPYSFSLGLIIIHGACWGIEYMNWESKDLCIGPQTFLWMARCSYKHIPRYPFRTQKSLYAQHIMYMFDDMHHCQGGFTAHVSLPRCGAKLIPDVKSKHDMFGKEFKALLHLLQSGWRVSLRRQLWNGFEYHPYVKSVNRICLKGVWPAGKLTANPFTRSEPC
jgi:hypothetical protein